MEKINWRIIPAFLLVCLLLLGCTAQDRPEGQINRDLEGQEAAALEISLDSPVLKEDTSGLAAESGGETEDKTVHLVFAGDILLSEHVTKAYDNAGGIQGVLDDGFRQEIGRADIFMANQEFPFSERGTAESDKQYTFRLPPSRINILQEIGADIVSLANNHALDFGREALSDTCSVLEDAGIRYVGAGDNLERARKLETIEVKGKTIGFLAASRVFPKADWAAGSNTPGMLSGYDPAVLLEEIQKAKEVSDYLAVYIHWGIEREEYPQEYQRALGKRIIDAGADIVVGSHPHVLQGIEYYNGKPIIYSLGNFIFGSSIPKTALLKVALEDGQARLSLVPGTSAAGYTRTLKEQPKLQDFYRYMESLSYGVRIDESGLIIP